MSTSALILMIVVQSIFTIVTGYFFYKVLTAPKRDEPDSFTHKE